MYGAKRVPSPDAAQIEGSTTPSTSPATSTAFGKYQLFASLGRGGMADVFLSVARGQMGFNKLAVIKRLRQSLAEEASFRNMFLDEARLAARLGHPNIVHTYEVGEQGGVFYIAMEYLEGQSLNKVLKEAIRRKETIEPAVAARIVADALAGLGYAHELRDYDGSPLSIIHRDVSPHNVFVTYDGHTKLVDFGIAKAALSSTETEVGVLKGKVAYMAPEQAMGGRIDCRSDLFAMGIVLWELLAHQRLMTGESAANTLHKLMNAPITRVSAVVPGIDPDLEAIVMRALEKEPDLRWQSAAEMRDALEGWISARARPVRQEDVGRAMQHLFMNVRDEVQRQIQRHMSVLNAATNTQELQALSAESLKRMQDGGAPVTGELLRLGNGSGSGSGVVPNYGGLSQGAVYPRLDAQSHSQSQSIAAPPPARASNALLIVITIGCFILAGLLIVVLGLRERRKEPAAITEPAPPAVALTAPPAIAQGSASDAPAAPAESATPVVASATASSSAKTAHFHGGAAPKSTAKSTSPVQLAEAPASGEPGYLTVSSIPWARVTESGRSVCEVTPCVKVKMTPGAHTLTFENAEQGLKQTITVTVRSGEETRKIVGLK